MSTYSLLPHLVRIPPCRPPQLDPPSTMGRRARRSGCFPDVPHTSRIQALWCSTKAGHATRSLDEASMPGMGSTRRAMQRTRSTKTPSQTPTRHRPAPWQSYDPHTSYSVLRHLRDLTLAMGDWVISSIDHRLTPIRKPLRALISDPTSHTPEMQEGTGGVDDVCPFTVFCTAGICRGPASCCFMLYEASLHFLGQTQQIATSPRLGF